VDVVIPFNKYGYFTLEVAAKQPGEEDVFQKTSFAVVSSDLPVLNGETPFGVSTHLDWTGVGWTGDFAKLIQRMGASFIRDGREWPGVELEEGVYTFDPTPNDYMKQLEEHDIKVLLISAFNNPLYDNNATPYTDAGRIGFAKFTEAYVNEYKDQLIGVNVYNEFNGGFGKRENSPANSRPEYYFKPLRETYNEVKPKHPDIPVVGKI